ncbi:MAG: metallopeptidase family protein [Patescibacteria group bacterium]|nr:metallopeptidase family protein [Patescibacteria group bacterium]
MKKEQFEKLIRETIKTMPKKFRDKLDNLEIVIEEWPRGENKFSLLGLYQGVPRTKRTTHYSGVLPDKITIFQKPIEKIGSNCREKICQIVKRTVWHEIAHHFGMDEKKVREVEVRKYRS